MEIRPETAADVPAVQALTEAAFAPMSFSDGKEVEALAGLRCDGDLQLSLVAEEGGEIIGHVAFSPVSLDGAVCNWIALGPIAVKRARQRQGVGSALVAAGAAAFKAQKALGLVLIGNPKVYRSMGFVSDGAMHYRDVPADIVQFLPFSDERPSGLLAFAPALE